MRRLAGDRPSLVAADITMPAKLKKLVTVANDNLNHYIEVVGGKQYEGTDPIQDVEKAYIKKERERWLASLEDKVEQDFEDPYMTFGLGIWGYFWILRKLM